MNNNVKGITPDMVAALTEMATEFKQMKGKYLEQGKVIDMLKEELKKQNHDLQCLDCASFSNIYQDKIVFPKTENPLVSILIPVYNEYKYTKTCLYSILQNTKNIDYEVIVADDNSYDETENILNDVENIQLSKNSINVGFLKNVNVSSQMAKGKYLCLLNNDTIPLEGWLDNLVQTLETQSDVGVVGAKYLYPNGLIQEAGSGMNCEGKPNWYGSNCKRDDEKFNIEREVDYCSGCGILIRKDAWDKVGGFDEKYAPAYYEDPDLSFTFKYKLGLKTLYQPKSEIIHFHNMSYRHTHYDSTSSHLKFCIKWQKELAQECYRHD